MTYTENNKFSILASAFIIIFALAFSFSVYQKESQGQGAGFCLQICSWIECSFPSQSDCLSAIEACNNDENCPDFECVFNSSCVGENKWEPRDPGGGGEGGEGGGDCEIQGWAWGSSGPDAL